MRLAALLLEHPWGATPGAYALSALFCFLAARLPARVDASGDLSSLVDQDRSLWDHELVSEGLRFLELSASGEEVSEYHVEAAIAAAHARAANTRETDWGRIVSLYDALMEMRPSPVVALNRAIAVAQKDGASCGIDEILATVDRERLAGYPFYAAALGELELRRGRGEKAVEYFREARRLARNEMERRFLERRMWKAEGLWP
jgi:RNA polymerase sigma-70 factor (ECF subfamily)